MRIVTPRWLCRVTVTFSLTIGFVISLFLASCRSSNSVPDYIPHEVIAKKEGGSLAYEIDYSKRGGYQPPLGVDSNAAVETSVPPVSAPPASIPPPVVAKPIEAPVSGEPTVKRLAYGEPESLSIGDKGLRSATLSWSAPIDQVYRYRIERAELPDGPFVKVEEVAPRKLEYVEGGTPSSILKDNTTYYYRIVPIIERDGVEGQPSKVLKTITAPPPVPPIEVQASAPGSRAALVKWMASPVEGVMVYWVERALASLPDAFERVGVVKGTTFTDGGTSASVLKDSTKYLYRVIAINRVNSESAPSQAAEMTTLPPPVPVRKLSADSDEVRCVPLTWEPSPEPDVIRYDVYRSRTMEDRFQRVGSVPSRVITQYLDGETNPGKLEDEGTYYYQLRAINSVTAESADSETVRAITHSVPPEVQQVGAVPGRPREIPMSWAVAQDKTVMGYELWRAVEGGDDWSQVVRISGKDVTNYLDRGGAKEVTGLGLLKDGTVYQYKVIAFNTANVRSSASSAVSARTKYSPKPPEGLVATTNLPLSIRLTWTTNSETDIRHYVVECSDRPTESFRKMVAVSASGGGVLTAKEMPLESNVARYYRIKAVDRDTLESEWSKVEAGRSKPVPDAPYELQVQPIGNTVRVTWKAPAQPDIRRYKVWRKRFVGWDVVTTTDQTEYLFEFAEAAKPMTVSISAVDRDELESGKSASIEVRLGL